jgi:hypothetical protein
VLFPEPFHPVWDETVKGKAQGKKESKAREDYLWWWFVDSLSIHFFVQKMWNEPRNVLRHVYDMIGGRRHGGSNLCLNGIFCVKIKMNTNGKAT